MDRYELADKLRQTIGDYLQSRNLELVGLIYRYEGSDLFLRVLADTPEGNISLDECASANADLGRILDSDEDLKERYILEVSSPGLDRPLATQKDFKRCLNRKARFFLKEQVNGKIEWEGIISKVEEDKIFVDIDGASLEIEIGKINKAKQVI